MPKKPYSKEFKESILKRLVPPNAEHIPTLSEETGIPVNTLYTWRTKLRKDNPTSNKSSSNWSSSDKFQAVLETASLSELKTAKYCREKGIHLEELKSWIKQCQDANNKKAEDPEELKNNLKKEQSKNKELAKELRTKEKALAETAALLVLRKKANAIWGDPEEN